MWANWTRCSGRTSALAPTSRSSHGRAGDGHGQGQRRPVDAARALDVEQAGGQGGAGGAGRDERVGLARADGAGRLDDRGLRGVAARRGPGRPPWRSRPARRRPRRRRRTSPSSAAARRGARARHRSATASAAPAATSAGPRSAPFASTATVTVIGGLVLGRALTRDDLAAGVGAAVRAHAMRAARGVALRAGVADAACRSLCWERRLVVRACDCFCFGTAMRRCSLLAGRGVLAGRARAGFAQRGSGRALVAVVGAGLVEVGAALGAQPGAVRPAEHLSPAGRATSASRAQSRRSRSSSRRRTGSRAPRPPRAARPRGRRPSNVGEAGSRQRMHGPVERRPRSAAAARSRRRHAGDVEPDRDRGRAAPRSARRRARTARAGRPDRSAAPRRRSGRRRPSSKVAAAAAMHRG